MDEKQAFWKDPHGRHWFTPITVGAIKRAKELAGVNLLDVFDGTLLFRLADDPVLLVNTLYAVCKPQADERGVTDEQFGELLAGDTFEQAVQALVEGLASFFPSERRQMLQRLWAETQKRRTATVTLMADKLV